jgi:ABC-2 type transport system permease protein
MRYWLRVYRVNLRVAWALMMQYRFSTLIWAVWGFVGPLISLAVWTAATQARGSGVMGNSQRFEQADFAAYFLVYMIFGHLTMSWDAFEFAYRVRTGSLSPQLLRPLHPIHADASFNIGFKALTTVLLLPAWLVLFAVLHPTPPTSWANLVLAAPAVLLAGMTRYIWQYALAAIAFWTTRVDAINQLYYVLDSFLAGRIAPIALMPMWLGVLARYTPFYGMGAFPVEVALGRVELLAVAQGLASQMAWLAVGVVVFRMVWSAGVKQYSAVGA